MTDESVEIEIEAELAPEVPLGRRLLAEFLGTTLFVAAGTGAATVMLLGPLKSGAAAFSKISDIFENGDPAAVRLYSSLHVGSGGDVIPVALAFAFTLAILV